MYPSQSHSAGRTDPDRYTLPAVTNTHRDHTVYTTSQLKQWIHSLSWDYCELCNSVYPCKLLPPHLQSKRAKQPSTCPCTTSQYVIPQPHHIPEPLTSLSWQDNAVLSPFILDCGPYEHKQHGYRCKTGLSKVLCNPRSVVDRINDLSDNVQQEKCHAAYSFLMTCPDSSYKHYIDIAEELRSSHSQPSVFDVFQWVGIECSLWPVLYPYTSWCESAVLGTSKNRSSKAAFVSKCFSPVADYALHFNLMQFMFDRWLYKTIPVAIHSSTGRTGHSSQYQLMSALDSKPFSPEYWKWQHRYLIDAVRQYGYPSLFITISPYEWSFTRPLWIQELMSTFQRPPHSIPFFLNFHFLHTLEQVIRGYMCGANNSKWRSQLFSTGSRQDRNNVLTYFYRYEFQERGTLHVHLLVWLRDLSSMQYPRIKADVPPTSSYLYPYVTRFQKSHKSSLPRCDTTTNVSSCPSGKSLHISHNEEAFILGLRGYIDTILPALQCSMDVQVATDNSLLLQYVSGYVSKWKESYHCASAFTAQSPPSLTAFRYLASLSICEPEMWMLLTNKKLSWCDSTRVSFRVPDDSHAATNKEVVHYYARPHHHDNLSLLEYLRLYNTSVTPPKLYKDNASILVGLQYLSIYNPKYFFQYLLVNYPHRRVDDILLPTAEDIPPQLVHFAVAHRLMPEHFTSTDHFADELQKSGNTHAFTRTACH